MIHPFTRFDFNFQGEKVAADYEDIDGILYFIFKINDRTEFSARIHESSVEFFVELENLHYGETISDGEPQSAYKGTGLPAACVDQLMRKHPELRFFIRSALANEPALRLAENLAKKHAYFFVI